MERWLERFALANFRRSADTAHDLKTPLNVAVLNLELLRMRLRKVTDVEDEKIAGHTQAIDVELRRLGRIFDAFFVLSTPPRDSDPQLVDAAVLASEAAAETGMQFASIHDARVDAHPERLAEMFKHFFSGARKLIPEEGRATACLENTDFIVEVAGPPAGEVELAKVFKFYHTDQDGNPDLSLAVARLIAETYGGDLSASEDGDGMVLRLSLPLGER